MVVSKEGCLAITPSAMQVSANVLDAQHHTEFTHTNFLKGGIDEKLLTRRNREDLRPQDMGTWQVAFGSCTWRPPIAKSKGRVLGVNVSEN